MKTKQQNQQNQIVVGLDIGTTKICAIVGCKNDYGKIDILGIGKVASEGVSKGVVVNINKTTEAIKAAIELASISSDHEINYVQVGIAGRHIRSQINRSSIMRTKAEEEIGDYDLDRLASDVSRLAMEPGESILHVLPQVYCVDRETGIKDPVGRTGLKLECDFHVITGQIVPIENIKRCVAKAELNVAGIMLEPMASAEAVLAEEEKENGVVLVDIGGGTTDVAIFEDGLLRHTAVIPFGGNSITEDIRGACHIMRKTAEEIKVQHGVALADKATPLEYITIPGVRGRDPKEILVKNLALIIESRVTEIFESVITEIEASGYHDMIHTGIVVTGGGSQLKHLKQLVEYVTGLPTRIGNPNEHLSNGLRDELANPMYSTAIGLVIQALEGVEPANPQLVNKKEARKKTSTDTGGTFIDKVGNGIKNWFNDTGLDKY